MARLIETYGLLSLPFIIIVVGALAAEFLPRILRR